MLSQGFRARAVRAVIAISTLTVAAACGGDTDGDLTGTGTSAGSSFTATITGGSAGSYSGLASAVPSVGLFSIGMSSTDGKFALAFTRNGDRPGVGMYSLGPTIQTGFTATLNINSGEVLYSSSTGTLTITSSSSTEMRGTFSFTGTVAGGTGASANVSGSFVAPCPVGC